MNRFNELVNYGYTLSELYSYMKDNKLSINKNNIFINDYNLLIDIINNTDDRFVLRHFVELKIDFQICELFRLIRIGKYEIAHMLAKKIYNDNKIPEVKLILDNLTYSKDSIKYIVEEDGYDNKEMVDKYKKLEMDMLLDFYMGNIELGGEKISELLTLYVRQNPIDFKAYIVYLNKIEELKLHHTKINTRNDQGAMGDPLAVVTGLLLKDDYYRAHNVLKEFYIDNVQGEFSVIWEIIRLLDLKLMVILNENKKNVEKQIELNSNGLNDESTIIGKYDLSSFTEDKIKKLEKEKNDVDMDTNYYKIYQECLNQNKYQEAKDAIIKYQYVVKKRGLNFNLEHLIYEVDVMRENYYSCSPEELKKRDEFVNKGNQYLDEFKYKDALDAYKESLKYERRKSPLTLSKIGECYLKLGKYLDAYISYKLEEKDYLYPDDYVYLVECLYRLKITERAEYYVSKYEETQHTTSSFMHYILSLMYIDKKMYKKALDEISTCEIICMEENGLALNFCYERNILHALINGKDVQPYILDNYYDHTFSEKELDKIMDLDIDSIDEGEVIEYVKSIEYGESLEEMIDYLLTLYKVLKEMDRRVDAKDLLMYLEDIIKSPELSEYDKNNFTQVLKNYRNL